MAENIKANKSASADAIQIAIDEATPWLVYEGYRRLPQAWREKLKSHQLIKYLPSIISFIIARITPNGGFWELFDDFRVELFSSLGQAISGKGPWSLLDGEPPMPVSSMGLEAVLSFQQAAQVIQTMNLFVIDEGLRDSILIWMSLLPAEEQVGAMGMVQSMSRDELNSFADTHHKAVVWRSHPKHPANKPVKKSGSLAKAFDDFEKACFELNRDRIEPAVVEQKKLILDLQNRQDQENEETFLDRLKLAFRLF